MDRNFEYTIQYDDITGDRFRILDYLKNLRYSAHLLTKLKHIDGSVKINGTSAPLNHVLSPNDILIVNIPEESSDSCIPPTNLPIDIIYEDEDILVVNKSASMPIHPSQRHHEDTLANALMHYYRNENFVFRCLTRLDKDTSGLVLIAKNILASSILSEDMVEGKIIKEYTALCEGELGQASGTISAKIARKEGSTIERIVDESGQEAVTHYELIQNLRGHALVKLRLETGRTHQIRVHMKHIGHPLVGDYIYNPDNQLMNRQALHCSALSFTHPITSEILALEAPTPNDINKIIHEFST